MPTPEALVAAAQGAGARITRRKPGAGGASPSTSAAPAPKPRQDLSSAADGKITGRGGREQELGAAAQRRLAAFRPPAPSPTPSTEVLTPEPSAPPPVPAWQRLRDAGIAGQGSRAANVAKLASLTPPPAPPPGDGSVSTDAAGAAPPAPPAPGGAMPPDPGAIMSRLRAFRPRTAPGPGINDGIGDNIPPEMLDRLAATLGRDIRGLPAGAPVGGPGPMEANILPGVVNEGYPAVTDVARANPLPGGDMRKPMFGAPTATAGPAPWDELAGAVTRRRRPMGGAGERSGGAMGDLGGASY